MTGNAEAASSPTRSEIDGAIERGEFALAGAQIAQLFRDAPTLANTQFVLDRMARCRQGTEPAACRVAFLRSFTIEPVLPLLRASAALHGLDITAQVGEFNTYAQEILNPASSLYQFNPQIVVLAVQTRDLMPATWERFADLSSAEVLALVDEAEQSLRGLVGAFRSRSKAHLILHNFEEPAVSATGIFDAQSACGQREAIVRLNASLRRIAADHTGVYILDYDALVARHGRERWYDERKWLTARMPISADCLIHLGREYLRFLLPLTGRVCKALVVDLDNTLWGGVVGEEGVEGIKIGPEYPGASFVALQRAILDLYRRGVILAIASKNNSDDAMEALTNHPEMLLRPEHFAALRINWNDKAQSLREIAKELNIGLDAVAFLDDNPVERQRIQIDLPEVTVLDLPRDPAGYAAALRESPVFERLALSEEDRERGRLYAEQRQRVELEESASSLEDFYRSLQMAVEIGPVTAQNLARVAQLTQKTNQFNTTTRRYSEQEIEELASDPKSQVYTARVRDRFGDNGLVGVAIVRAGGESHEIDTFLLSCRVIGRTIETAILAYLARDARERGASYLTGWFLPTKKNAPAKGFYASHGFVLDKERDGGALWRLDLAANEIACPEWVTLDILPGQTNHEKANLTGEVNA
ncbi:MAG TPA: HAD-IIIC family phosphatase [Capsulimonadaceae bacterium]|nr:HAD-IIIC family phosphatase [Capsulimonadaceae bacterium]